MAVGSDLRTDAIGRWVSPKPGSFIEYAFQVPSKKWSVGIVLRRMRQNAGHINMAGQKQKRCCGNNWKTVR